MEFKGNAVAKDDDGFGSLSGLIYDIHCKDITITAGKQT
jgi:hypothetical protein